MGDFFPKQYAMGEQGYSFSTLQAALDTLLSVCN